MSGMERISWQRHEKIRFNEFENRRHRKTLFVTDVWRNKFEGKNSIDDLSFPF